MTINQAIKEIKKVRNKTDNINRFDKIAVFYNTATKSFDIKDATFERYEYPTLDWICLVVLHDNSTTWTDKELKQYLLSKTELR